MSWNKSVVYWREGDTAFVSVAFTWHLQLALKLCRWNKEAGLRVLAGGPAIDLGSLASRLLSVPAFR